MKIRSITYFLDPGWPIDEQAVSKAGDFISAARHAFQQTGYEVQTVRLATTPFAALISAREATEVIQLAKALEEQARQIGFDYVSLGPALPQYPQSYDLVCELITETEIIFTAGAMTTSAGAVSLQAVRACAQIIHTAAGITADGFANLRFAALANVPAGAPFFPAAYHQGGLASFALATEAADLAVEAFQNASSLAEARHRLIERLEFNASLLESTSEKLSEQFSVAFGGIDFTLAPYPQIELSFGTALENLGVPTVGLHGSLAAAAMIADTLDQAAFRRAGFNGLMMPVLEDAILAKRAAQGTLSLKDLMLFSTVCGTGLDTIPLPGDTSVEQLYAVLLDLAALSLRLDKPLTARLMPIPGGHAGDPTRFDFEYFANSHILALDAAPLGGALSGSGDFPIHPR